MEMSATDYENSLAHYGILRKSGRYPWGSGANPFQRSKTFLSILEGHKRDGLSDAQIAALYDDAKNGFPFSVADLRAKRAISVNIQKQDQIRQAQRLKDKGMGYSEIAKRMSVGDRRYNESTIRSLLTPGRQDKLDVLHKTADMLKRQVDEKGMLDIGAHVERDLPLHADVPNVGISKDKFATAVSMLKEEGYQVHTFKAPQVGTGEMTNYKVLVKPKPGMSYEQTRKDVFINRDKLRLISEKSDDGGRTWRDLSFQKPPSIDPKRVGVQYKENGGAEHDGVIYVRPGVKDVSLGKSQYAQVRIAVGGTHFLKGMAVYKDDLPKGVDIVFNTNKSNTGNKLDAMKPMKTNADGKVDWTNPFGAFPKPGGQLKDEHGNITSAMNILNEQGDWNKWSRTLSSQVLSKQKPDLARKQLDVTYDRKLQEFAEIKALTNPLIKRKLLETFGEEVDSAGVKLKAANMPHQATKVILPVSSLKPTEVYAPTFKNGTKVSLIRFPHAGTFEIPEVTVNNRNKEAERLFTKHGTHQIEAPDAIGIHPRVAERLSGADFDGDHVVMIPHTPRGKLENRDPLEKLKGFDPRSEYKPYDGMRTIDGGVYNAKTGQVDYGHYPDGRPRSPKTSPKGTEMGKVTNLISDMTLRGATDDELARAVRHSMVVIDAEKHSLDYKASERDHGILDLKRTYQGVNPRTGQPRGASTLITRATARTNPDPVKRKAAPADHPGSGEGVTRLGNITVDRKTGEKVFVPTGEINKHTGKPKTFRSKKLAETTDAFTLVSDHGGTEIERVYAAHANRLKALANDIRLEAIRTQPIKRSSSAAKVYHKEVESLKAKLNIALQNAPRERQAQLVANQIVAQRRRANPDMEESEKKKIRGQALEAARFRTGANKDRVPITDREWEAIQNGAVSSDTLKKILANTDVDKLRERATPRLNPVMTSTMTSRAQQMRSSGATYAEISDALGIPQSTLQSSLAQGNGNG